jgi:hypothetical protein
MNYTQEQKKIITKINWHFNNGADKNDLWILKTLEDKGITIPLSLKYSQEELQEQQKDRERIQNELQELKDIPLDKEYEDFGTFDNLYNPIMYGDMEVV